MTVLINLTINKDIKSKRKLCRQMFTDVLPTFAFTASETMRDYY